MKRIYNFVIGSRFNVIDCIGFVFAGELFQKEKPLLAILCTIGFTLGSSFIEGVVEVVRKRNL